MSDPVAIDSHEEAVIPVPRMKKRIARALSHIFSPAPVALPLILLVAFYKFDGDTGKALGYASLTFAFLALGPFLYICMGVVQGKFTDIDVSERSQRTGPFLFTICSAIVGYLTAWFLHTPRTLETLILSMIFSCVLLLVITFWWKISIHTTALGAAATILSALYGMVMWPIYMLVIIVGWSRVVLHRHTVAQVIGGTFFGILAVLLALALRGI